LAALDWFKAFSGLPCKWIPCPFGGKSIAVGGIQNPESGLAGDRDVMPLNFL
jgi:hypothetical protein